MTSLKPLQLKKWHSDADWKQSKTVVEEKQGVKCGEVRDRMLARALTP